MVNSTSIETLLSRQAGKQTAAYKEAIIVEAPAGAGKVSSILRKELRARRSYLIRTALRSATFAKLTSVQAAVLQRTLRPISAGPPRQQMWIDNWSAALALRKMLSSSTNEVAAFRLLLAELLFSSDGSSASVLDGLDFDLQNSDDGKLLVPGEALTVTFFEGTPNAVLNFSCGSRSVRVADRGSGQHIDIPLPFDANAKYHGLVVDPFERVGGLNAAVLPESVAIHAGFTGLPHFSSAELPFPTLAHSIGHAWGTLGKLWPEMQPWISALVPAFFDLGVSESAQKRVSGSFEPGVPIYLSRVSDAFQHAEDLVHETQHLRFPLTVPAADWFGKWNDFSPVFTSPYRTDPRPLQGVHLGLHAFLAVTELRLRALRAAIYPATGLRDLLDTHWRNLFALHTIQAHEQLLEGGRSYYETISRRLGRQSSAIDGWLQHSGQEIDSKAVRADFLAERVGHNTLNAAISFPSHALSKIEARK